MDENIFLDEIRPLIYFSYSKPWNSKNDTLSNGIQYQILSTKDISHDIKLENIYSIILLSNTLESDYVIFDFINYKNKINLNIHKLFDSKSLDELYMIYKTLNSFISENDRVYIAISESYLTNFKDLFIDTYAIAKIKYNNYKKNKNKYINNNKTNININKTNINNNTETNINKRQTNFDLLRENIDKYKNYTNTSSINKSPDETEINFLKINSSVLPVGSRLQKIL